MADEDDPLRRLVALFTAALERAREVPAEDLAERLRRAGIDTITEAQMDAQLDAAEADHGYVAIRCEHCERVVWTVDPPGRPGEPMARASIHAAEGIDAKPGPRPMCPLCWHSCGLVALSEDGSFAAFLSRGLGCTAHWYEAVKDGKGN